ncbi:MAG: transporter substrate-binding domain-containing protein [Alphaproteobacteria bacterium]|nr:transporter substrate-binding domain-containing protein [Alphaproteobacteria bacterium]
MKNKLSIAAIILSLLALGANYLPKSGEPSSQQAPVKESTYDRIMRTKTIRCAYLVWPPYMTRDATTGKLGGVYYDVLERMAKDWSMKVDWAEEVGTANRFEGFATGRYDMLCSPVGATPERTAVSDFSIPMGYQPFYLYARADDMRFDNAYNKVNDQSITLLTLDGYMAAAIIKSEFPNAKLLSLPNLSSDADVLMSIQMGKADASVCDPSLSGAFLKNNPGKMKQVDGPPIRILGETISFPLNEPQLRAKINTTIQFYLDTGVIDKILTANTLTPEKLLRVAKPYEPAH